MNMSDVPSNKVDLHEKLMTVRLNCSFGLTNRVTAKDLTEELNTQKQTRKLLVKKEKFPDDSGKYLKALHAVLAEFYLFHVKKTMSSVNDGERLMPVAFLLDYMQKYNEYVGKVDDAFNEFVDNYDQSINQVKNHPEHGKTFDEDDYPDKHTLHKLLKFKVITLPLPKASQGLLNIVGESVQNDLDVFMGEAIAHAFSDVNARIREGLERMVLQLSDPKKKVYDSMTDSMSELCNNLIPSFNVTNDDSLNLLAEEIKEKLLIYRVDELRHDEVIRKNVATEAADILRRMGL